MMQNQQLKQELRMEKNLKTNPGMKQQNKEMDLVGSRIWTSLHQNNTMPSTNILNHQDCNHKVLYPFTNQLLWIKTKTFAMYY